MAKSFIHNHQFNLNVTEVKFTFAQKCIFYRIEDKVLKSGLYEDQTYNQLFVELLIDQYNSFADYCRQMMVKIQNKDEAERIVTRMGIILDAFDANLLNADMVQKTLRLTAFYYMFAQQSSQELKKVRNEDDWNRA